MSAHDLLFELRTEELPPRTLLTLSTALTEGVLKGIDDAGIPHGKVQSFATPRRLALRIQKLAEHQPDKQVERRGPPLVNSFDARGAPTQAAIAFAKKRCSIKPCSACWFCIRLQHPSAYSGSHPDHHRRGE